MRDHQELDDRSLALHRLIAEKIRQDPSLFNKARATLASWRTRVSSRSQPYLDEWESLMNQGIEACMAVAVEESEHATALRQSSPLSGLLSNQDRFAFLKTWTKDGGHVAH